MIFYPVEPRSEEWKRLRLGIPCSSEFHRIITAKKLELSKQAAALMYRLLGEWVTGEPDENDYQSMWMERGIEWEDACVSAYECLNDVETSLGGFFTTDDGMLGCSPDRLVGAVGDMEAKAPKLSTQISYALGDTVDDEYRIQLQGRLMIHEREWIDIFSYHPRLPLPAVRVRRDDEMIAKMRPALNSFVDVMLAKREELERRFGPFTRLEPEPEVVGDKDAITNEDVERILAAQREGRVEDQRSEEATRFLKEMESNGL